MVLSSPLAENSRLLCRVPRTLEYSIENYNTPVNTPLKTTLKTPLKAIRLHRAIQEYKFYA